METAIIMWFCYIMLKQHRTSDDTSFIERLPNELFIIKTVIYIEDGRAIRYMLHLNDAWDKAAIVYVCATDAGYTDMELSDMSNIKRCTMCQLSQKDIIRTIRVTCKWNVYVRIIDTPLTCTIFVAVNICKL